MRTVSWRLSPGIFLVVLSLSSCADADPGNPFFAGLNEPVAYAEVTAEHVTAYAEAVSLWASDAAAVIESEQDVTFESIIRPFDAISNALSKAGSNSWTLYWVSPDSATRAAGFAAFQKMDSLGTALMSQKGLFDRVVAVAESQPLTGARAKLVEDLLVAMRQTGVELSPDDLATFKALRVEINDLSMRFSTNMNADIPTLEVDEAAASGIPDGI